MITYIATRVVVAAWLLFCGWFVACWYAETPRSFPGKVIAGAIGAAIGICLGAMGGMAICTVLALVLFFFTGIQLLP